MDRIYKDHYYKPNFTNKTDTFINDNQNPLDTQKKS